jgi:DNA-binding GntR family transcriptional regulator
MRKVRSVQIYEALRSQILKGELEAGSRLITRELSGTFAVSDIPVREALWMLARDGLVEMNAYSGARVASLTREEVLEVLFVRSHLEGLATEMAATRIDDDGLALLQGLIERMEGVVASTAPDPLEYSALNRQFHSVIFDYSGNSRLTKLIHSIWEGHSNLQTVFRHKPDRLAVSLEEHRRIFEALRSHDGALAGRLAAEHKKLQQQDLLAVIETENAKDDKAAGVHANQKE